ncbi:M-phase inducer phosphatase 2 isoform X1 [Dendrobates tinctorius]|uniref:M-phase inducer phosphatase 2 isoform X1 n=1 Tax=Dendrobates tinctorius TaxID=92724 RepID=UPI003CC9D2E3
MEITKLLREFSPSRPKLPRPCTLLPCGRSLRSPDTGGVLSPVTSLAFTMNRLTGLGGESDTPKRTLEMPSLSRVEMASLSRVEMPSLSRVEMPSLSRVEMPCLSRVEMPCLSRVEMPSLSRVEMASLSRVEMPSLSRVEMPSLSRVEMASLSRVEMPSLSRVEMPSLSRVEMASLSPVEMPSLSPVEMPSLSRVEMASLSRVEMASLSRVEMPSLSRVEMPSLSRVEMASLSRVEMPSLSRVEMPSLSRVEMPSLGRVEMASLSRVEMASLSRTASSDSGLCMDYLSPLDPDLPPDIFQKSIFDRGVLNNDCKASIRRQSLPVTLLHGSPVLRRLYSTSDLDITSPREVQPAAKDNKENEVFLFKRPFLCPVSRTRLRSHETFKSRPNSAPSLMFSPEGIEYDLDSESPVRLRKSSLTFSLKDEDDDGFMEIMDDDERKEEPNLPTGMENLLCAPLKEDTRDVDLVIRSKCRRLFRSPSMPSSIIRPVLKRMDRPDDGDTPVKPKRHKNVAVVCVAKEEPDPVEPKLKLGRSKSLCVETVEKILDDDQGDLIGDSSKTYLLKTVEGQHQDLKYITPEMMNDVLNGKYTHQIDRCIVVDCRYPYEYEGGHIRGAVNLPMEHDVEEFLLKTPIVPSSEDKRVIIIFHCEFSSERGPRMCRFVRMQDRSSNEYPKLHYPELYVLKGGYKEFFPGFQTLCEPQAYRSMYHKDFKEDLKLYRAKSRTWGGDRSKREIYRQQMKL